MTRSTGDIEPHDGIDPHNNPETRASEDAQTSARGLASDGGPPPSDAPVRGSAPEVRGTGAGSPLDGVLIDDEAAQQAVSGDTGPEHPGTR